MHQVQPQVNPQLPGVRMFSWDSTIIVPNGVPFLGHNLKIEQWKVSLLLWCASISNSVELYHAPVKMQPMTKQLNDVYCTCILKDDILRVSLFREYQGGTIAKKSRKCLPFWIL